MLEFDPNTLAFMTAALEQCCKKLKNDTPEARRIVAEKLKECARRGRVTQIALTEAGQRAVAELNGNQSNQQATGWQALLRWVT
jgi:hypothetical protein